MNTAYRQVKRSIGAGGVDKMKVESLKDFSFPNPFQNCWTEQERGGASCLKSCPITLTFRPLIACLAAGNTVIIKPSELTPHSSKLIKEIIESVFPKDEVFVMEGGAEVASELLELPFNHILYIGGTKVGKIVMKAAANLMTSVTMEVGGKCPSIIDDSADFADAAGKIVWTKFFNCGQTCITTDYVLVSENRKDEFITHLKGTIEHIYGVDGPGIESSKYGRLVNNKHYQRVKWLLDDALENGATLVTGGKTNVYN